MSDKKPLILYVDDDPDYREAVRVMLETAGYEMAEAATAAEGLQAFKSQKPDFVIVDLMMEEVDSGTNLVKELRAAGRRTPIYLLSSVGDNLDQTVDYAELGLDGVFQKPLERAALLAVLKAKLGR